MSIHVRSRTPLIVGMALILALPLVLTAGIGIYRAESAPPPAAGFAPESQQGEAARDADTRADDAR